MVYCIFVTFNSDLYHGKYYVKEEVRKPGYLPNEEIWEMNASYTDQNLAEIKLTKEVENQPTESQFTKTDATTGEELEGAKLQIIDEDGSVTKVEMKDDYFKVEISKTDITTGEELEGAKLQILNKEGEILEECF